MKLVKWYKTKAKWPLIHRKEVPHTGWQGDPPKGSEYADPGMNAVFHGTLLLTGTARGRSSAKFVLRSPSGDSFTMTVTGAESLFRAVADGRMVSAMGVYNVPVPSFTGYWTIAKQGTDYTLIPAASDIIPDQ